MFSCGRVDTGAQPCVRTRAARPTRAQNGTQANGSAGAHLESKGGHGRRRCRSMHASRRVVVITARCRPVMRLVDALSQVRHARPLCRPLRYVCRATVHACMHAACRRRVSACAWQNPWGAQEDADVKHDGGCRGQSTHTHGHGTRSRPTHAADTPARAGRRLVAGVALAKFGPLPAGYPRAKHAGVGVIELGMSLPRSNLNFVNALVLRSSWDPHCARFLACLNERVGLAAAWARARCWRVC